jgi:TPR repeat protein
MLFIDKYLKYKNKYIYLKKIQKGGVECDNAVVYRNIIDTCWMIAIQMIFSFGDVTSNILENIMEKINIHKYKEMEQISDQINDFIENRIQKVQNDCNLKNVFPAYIFDKYNIVYLKNILYKFIVRYYSKVFKIKNRYANPEYDYYVDNTSRCELVIVENYDKIFSKYKRHGGIIDEYLFANILSIFLLDYKISLTSYYNNDFSNITYDDKINIGIIILIDGHACCFFICNNVEKYYNDNDKKIFNCEWKNILKKSSNENCLYVKKEGCIELLNKEQYICYKNKSELSIVERLIVVSKNIQNSIIDNQIQNILNEKNLDKICDKALLFELGKIYDKDESQDDKQAIKYYKLSAEQGYGKALFKLGKIYEKKSCTKQPNYCKAIKYFKLAAKQGYDEALYKLGFIYDEGEYLPKNYSKAFKYFKLAADKGNRRAQYNIASMYHHGDGVKEDCYESTKYMKLAADQGDSRAQYLVGVAYENGYGVEKNVKIAIEYYQLAAEQEHQKATYSLQRLLYDE